jgi:hypothetical protein
MVRRVNLLCALSCAKRRTFTIIKSSTDHFPDFTEAHRELLRKNAGGIMASLVQMSGSSVALHWKLVSGRVQRDAKRAAR